MITHNWGRGCVEGEETDTCAHLITPDGKRGGKEWVNNWRIGIVYLYRSVVNKNDFLSFDVVEIFPSLQFWVLLFQVCFFKFLG